MIDSVFFQGLLINLMFAFFGWLLSLYRKNVTHVDSMWSLFFVLTTYYYIDASNISPRVFLVIGLVILWAIRLSAFLTLRNWGKPEDKRYIAIRINNRPFYNFKSLYIIFGFQAVLAWIVSIALCNLITSDTPISFFDFIGASIVLMGILYESFADHQLMQFKKNPNNKSKLCNIGLWKYSRHPNYFGEILVWWGFYVMTLSQVWTWSLISPLLMTFLITKITGVTLLEANLDKHYNEYSKYRSSVNSLLPSFWKK